MNEQALDMWRNLDAGYSSKESKEAHLRYFASKDAHMESFVDVILNIDGEAIKDAIEKACVANGMTNE